MPDSERISTGSGRKRLIFIVALAIFMAPCVGKAEPLLLVNVPLPEATRKPPKGAVDVGLNGNGDLVIRRGAVALTMAYSPPEEIIAPQELIRMIQRQDCPSISGLSLRISLLF